MEISELKKLLLDNIKTTKEEKIQDNQLFLSIERDEIPNASKFIKEHFSDNIVLMEHLFGTDFPDREEMELLYTWWIIDEHLLFHMRVVLSYSDLSIKSIQDDWTAINWHEREAWEMLGINFEGHPNLKQFLLPDELVGTYPMRKAFKLRE